ncbi:MAG: type 1 glutamine amidotransferase [Planctomycetales bacterium]|nr:type 1 glutamine amidotransferase [Planctomycetales bacterium]
MVHEKLRFLLLQVRNPDDSMRGQEINCFRRALGCRSYQITPWDLLAQAPDDAELDAHDVVLLGGSGHYSATSRGAWIEPILDCLRKVHATSKPTFASCWGFQAMARALGGEVIKDLPRAELGTHWLHLTPAGHADPIFAPLGEIFGGQMGHEDRVLQLPPDAIRLASTDLVDNQAYRFRDKPIYCTQFHPELNIADLMGRVQQYPEYIRRICGMPPERFGELLAETPATEKLIARFVNHVFA